MKRFLNIALSLLLTMAAYSIEYADTAIYQGMNFKFDLGTPVFEMARSSANIQSYELALNVDLKHRYFPTIEMGYAHALNRTVASGATFNGMGGYARLGLDIAPLKKGNADNMLLVGLRVGTALQDYSMLNVPVADPYWQTVGLQDYMHRFRCDVWGEIVAGVQVQVYKSFHMGWFVRMKILMTRGKQGEPVAYYIPGYGYTEDTNFGFNYYIGWKF